MSKILSTNGISICAVLVNDNKTITKLN